MLAILGSFAHDMGRQWRRYRLGILLAGLSLACSATAYAQVGSITQQSRQNWNCYNFDIVNAGDRTIKDLHFTFPKGFEPWHMNMPNDWSATADLTDPNNESLTFETPPTQSTRTASTGPGAPAPAPSTVSPNMVAPGKSLSGFRFCLKNETKQVRIRFSYKEGADSLAEIFQGVKAGSSVKVRHNSVLHCSTLKIVAPADIQVFDIHFSWARNDIRPKFDDVVLPTGWKVTKTSDEELDIETGPTPLAPKKPETIDICLGQGAETINWAFTNKNHAVIEHTGGKITLRH